MILFMGHSSFSFRDGSTEPRCLALHCRNAVLPGQAVLLPSVIANFIPGVIAYVAFMKYQPRVPAWVFPPFLLLLLVIYMLRPSPALSWPVSLALGLALPFFRDVRQPFVVAASKRIATYSYGVYLWHTFGMKLAFHFLHPPVAQVAAERAITVVLSVAGYHLLEHPMVRLGNRLANEPRALA